MNWMVIEAMWRSKREREAGVAKLYAALDAFSRFNPLAGVDLLRRSALHLRASRLYAKIARDDES